MPGTLAQSADKKKRKALKGTEPSQKRAKSESTTEDSHGTILLLENEIVESKKNYNNITTLLEHAQNDEDDELAMVATVSLCRAFLRLLAAGALTRRTGQSEKEVVVVQWLKSRLSDYKQVVLTALTQDTTASTALTLAMRILKAESQYLSSKSEYSFPKVFLKDLVRVLVLQGSEDIRQEFCETFLGGHADILYFTFSSLKDILSDMSADEASVGNFDSAYDLLSFFEDVPESADDLGECYAEAPALKSHPVTSFAQQKKQGQEAWLALLNLNPNREQRKRVLEIMTRSVAPWFSKPELLADFLTDSYNTGGTISLLALSGVFYLIKERNLDYPSFYQKLYSLLDADILHSKHRSKFLRLLDTFLASTHLPAILVASFIKRLSRLCLHASPAAIVAIIPWIYNIFKKHPSCTFMIHRELRTADGLPAIPNEEFQDPFLADEHDPMKTHAIDSCLWELVQLQSHYHPNVATIAKVVSEQFTKQSYNIEDFLDHSYSSLLDAELSKQVKKGPVVEFMIPKRVYLPQDAESGADDSLLVKLWGFN